MMGRWRSVLVLLVTGPTATGPAWLTAQQPQVTLTEAVRRSLEVQPTVVQARGSVTTAAWQKRAAYGAFLPTVTLTSSAFRVNQQSVATDLDAVSPSNKITHLNYASSSVSRWGHQRFR